MLQTVIMNVSDVSQPQPQLGRPALHLWRKNYSRGRKRGVTFLSDLNINILPELLGETLSLCLRNITAVTEKRKKKTLPHICAMCLCRNDGKNAYYCIFSITQWDFLQAEQTLGFKAFEKHDSVEPDKTWLLWFSPDDADVWQFEGTDLFLRTRALLPTSVTTLTFCGLADAYEKFLSK